MQEATGLPSRSTVQPPQEPRSQISLAPVRSRWLRSARRSVTRGSTVTVRAAPLTRRARGTASGPRTPAPSGGAAAPTTLVPAAARPAVDLDKELGLSRQAVTERIRELERRGIIRGYRADVDPTALGLGVRAQLRITLDGKAPQKEKDVLRRLTASPLVRSVYRVSGEDCFVVDVICRRIEDVNALLLDLQSTRALQSSRTAFVLETVLEKGTLGPLPSALVAEEI